MSGMDQATARKRAKEIGGIAVSARPRSVGGWHVGGWPQKHDVWIVVSIGGALLDDGS